MTAFDQAWALLKQYSQTGLPGMEYRDDMQIFLDEQLEDEKVPTPSISHIQYDPAVKRFSLMGDEGEKISTIDHNSPRHPDRKVPKHIFGIDSKTYDPYGRQGYYGKLIQGLLSAGVDITSNERNSMSQGFHEKFQDNLTPNLNVSFSGYNEAALQGADDPDRPLGNIYNYSRKPIATFGDSDLAQRDYGALPIKINDGSLAFRGPRSRQKDLADFDPAFRQWELEQEKLKEEARQKSQHENVKHMNRVLDVIMGRIPKTEL